jgi:hypothetical protein
MEDEKQQSEPTYYPGNVLVAGAGFIVTGAGWGLFGYIEGDFDASFGVAIFLAMSVLHILTGALILSRNALALPLGLVVGTVGLIIATLEPQYVLVFTNVVIVSLLFLARNHIRANQQPSN